MGFYCVEQDERCRHESHGLGDEFVFRRMTNEDSEHLSQQAVDAGLFQS